MTRLLDKIEEIEKYISELQEFIPKDFDSYVSDLKGKAACERYFEKIVEAVTDLVIIIIKEENLDIPEEDKQSFSVLAENKIITDEMADKLRAAKGMRNILAHKYGTVDDEIVFHSITEELITDVKEFLSSLKPKDR